MKRKRWSAWKQRTLKEEKNMTMIPWMTKSTRLGSACIGEHNQRVLIFISKYVGLSLFCIIEGRVGTRARNPLVHSNS